MTIRSTLRVMIVMRVRTTTRMRTLAEGKPATRMAHATKTEVAGQRCWRSTPWPSVAGLDESAAMAIFADYRQIGSYVSGLSSRLKSSVDPTTCVVALQELSELLGISTEETLAGVRELVKILGVISSTRPESDEQGDSPSGQCLGGGLANIIAMQNLPHRPKDQVEEALSPTAVLPPPLLNGMAYRSFPTPKSFILRG